MHIEGVTGLRTSDEMCMQTRNPLESTIDSGLSDLTIYQGIEPKSTQKTSLTVTVHLVPKWVSLN